MRSRRYASPHKQMRSKNLWLLEKYCPSSQADAIKKTLPLLTSRCDEKAWLFKEILPLITSRCDQEDTASPHKQMRSKNLWLLEKYCPSSRADAIKKTLPLLTSRCDEKAWLFKEILPLITSRCDQEDTASPHKQMRSKNLWLLEKYCFSSRADAIKKTLPLITSRCDQKTCVN